MTTIAEFRWFRVVQDGRNAVLENVEWERGSVHIEHADIPEVIAALEKIKADGDSA